MEIFLNKCNGAEALLHLCFLAKYWAVLRGDIPYRLTVLLMLFSAKDISDIN